MHFFEARTLVPTTVTAGLLGFAMALLFGPAQAQQQPYLMKISTPTINDIPNAWLDGYAAMLEKDSGGRIKVQIFPASQLGTIPRQIEGTQFGSIQCVQIPPEFMVGLDTRFQVLAAPGLVDSDTEGQRLAADPEVRKLMLGLGADKGLHGLSVWYAAPNVLISRTPLRDIADFKGKKVRVFASPFQTVAFERLGITPVAMSLGDVLPALQQGAIDGAITGIGPMVKFHMVDAAKYVLKSISREFLSSKRSIRNGTNPCRRNCSISLIATRRRRMRRSLRWPPRWPTSIRKNGNPPAEP
jgi:TRAP-type transport system periplasmic protein